MQPILVHRVLIPSLALCGALLGGCSADESSSEIIAGEGTGSSIDVAQRVGYDDELTAHPNFDALVNLTGTMLLPKEVPPDFVGEPLTLGIVSESNAYFIKWQKERPDGSKELTYTLERIHSLDPFPPVGFASPGKVSQTGRQYWTLTICDKPDDEYSGAQTAVVWQEQEFMFSVIVKYPACGKDTPTEDEVVALADSVTPVTVSNQSTTLLE